MEKTQKRTLLILVILAVVYFALFIPPNLTGAQDVNMISAFEHDEFAQFPHVIRMLTPGDSAYQSLRNFVVYLHYYYGYPFYFFSALAILPLKFILGSGWAEHTNLIMLMLRQLINVLPMILAAAFMTWIATRFRLWWKSVLCFILLLAIPEVVSNNMWWHPDSLLTLFAVLTLFFLDRDDFKFGRNFYLSGVMCGLAIGSKILGVLFIFTYLTYLAYGLFSRKLRFGRILWVAFWLLVVVLGTIVISNPLLLLPLERAEIVNAFKTLLSENTNGFWVQGQSGGPGQFKIILDIFENGYASLPVIILSTLLLLWGLFHKLTRTRSFTILTWVVGFCSYFLFFASTIRGYYLLPVALPLLSGLVLMLPDASDLQSSSSHDRVIWRIRRGALSGIILLVLVIQMIVVLPQDYQRYDHYVNKEKTSGSLQLFAKVDEAYLSKIPSDLKVKIYRDWRAYVPPRKNFKIVYDWDLATYDYINQVDPDLIFIELNNAQYFSDPSKVENALQPGVMKKMVEFYGDVILEQLEGYQLLTKTDFGYVFAKKDFYDKYFQ